MKQSKQSVRRDLHNEVVKLTEQRIRLIPKTIMSSLKTVKLDMKCLLVDRLTEVLTVMNITFNAGTHQIESRTIESVLRV